MATGLNEDDETLALSTDHVTTVALGRPAERGFGSSDTFESAIGAFEAFTAPSAFSKVNRCA